MSEKMGLKTPIVLTIRSLDSGVAYQPQGDGSAALSYCFPEPFDLWQPHAMKLLYVHGPKKPIVCCASFLEPQAFNQEYNMVLPILLLHLSQNQQANLSK